MALVIVATVESALVTVIGVSKKKYMLVECSSYCVVLTRWHIRSRHRNHRHSICHRYHIVHVAWYVCEQVTCGCCLMKSDGLIVWLSESSELTCSFIFHDRACVRWAVEMATFQLVTGEHGHQYRSKVLRTSSLEVEKQRKQQ
jgi:hypothetical protein